MILDLKQPHEDIVGADRSDSYLLSLDSKATEHRDALVAMVWMLHSATPVGHPTPIARRIYDRISKPVPGDLVVEVTTLRSRGATRTRGFGILLTSRVEWANTDAEWASIQAEDPSLNHTDRPTEFAWYIQYGSLSGDICRWANCEFLALPINNAPRLTWELGS